MEHACIAYRPNFTRRIVAVVDEYGQTPVDGGSYLGVTFAAEDGGRARIRVYGSKVFRPQVENALLFAQLVNGVQEECTLTSFFKAPSVAAKHQRAEFEPSVNIREEDSPVLEIE